MGARGDRARIWTDAAVNERLAAIRPGVGDLGCRARRAALPITPRVGRDRGPVIAAHCPPGRVGGHSDQAATLVQRTLRTPHDGADTSLDGSSFQFQPVTYFDGQCFNELWHWSRDRPLSDRAAQRLPRAHVVDAQGRLMSLGQARVANIVGIWLIALTSDGRVVLVVQTAENSVTPGGVAASSSGSLDWADVVGHGPAGLCEVLMRGMLRELHEEAAVAPPAAAPRVAVGGPGRDGGQHRDGLAGCGCASTGEEHAEAVVGQVAVAAGEAPVELDDAVDACGQPAAPVPAWSFPPRCPRRGRPSPAWPRWSTGSLLRVVRPPIGGTAVTALSRGWKGACRGRG